jgi:hypothetical protein
VAPWVTGWDVPGAEVELCVGFCSGGGVAPWVTGWGVTGPEVGLFVTDVRLQTSSLGQGPSWKILEQHCSYVWTK